jgi:hypothetical protein
MGWYPSQVGPSGLAQATSPQATRGVFAFRENNSFASMRDGGTQTIMVSETSGNSIYTKPPSGLLTPALIGVVGAPIVPLPSQPIQPFDNLLKANSVPPAPAGIGGTGVSRTALPGGPYVFRSLFVATGTTLTGGPYDGGALSLYSKCYDPPANTPPYTNGAAYTGLNGFDVAIQTSGLLYYAYPPTFNAAYGPNSDWPGPDSAHPFIVQACFGDAHVGTIQQSVVYKIWAAMNTRQGGELLSFAE